MEKEDVEKLLDIAARSRLHTVLVGALLLAVGLTFALLGAHAIVLEITVTGLLMIVSGINTAVTRGFREIEGIPMAVLGVLFVVFVFVFEALHGLMLFLEFLSAGIVYLLAALGRREVRYGRRASLAIGIISLYVAVNLLVAHEESMDILITLMGIFLIALSVYVLWCAAKDRPVGNPFSGGEE